MCQDVSGASKSSGSIRTRREASSTHNTPSLSKPRGFFTMARPSEAYPVNFDCHGTGVHSCPPLTFLKGIRALGNRNMLQPKQPPPIATRLRSRRESPHTKGLSAQ